MQIHKGQDFNRDGNQYRSRSVNRADRPGKEATVNKPVVLNELEDYLNTPAGKRICEKQKYEPNQVFHR